MDKAARKGRRDPEKEKFWQGMMRAHEGSGQSVRGFCAEKGLNENLFYAWRRELKLRESEKTTRPGFVEVVSRGSRNGTGGVSIRIDERISIVLERGFDGETLKTALAAVCGAQ